MVVMNRKVVANRSTQEKTPIHLLTSIIKLYPFVIKSKQARITEVELSKWLIIKFAIINDRPKLNN